MRAIFNDGQRGVVISTLAGPNSTVYFDFQSDTGARFIGRSDEFTAEQAETTEITVPG